MAIADHPAPFCQRRFDDRFDQLYACRVKHQHFGFIVNHFVADRFDVQHQASQLFGQLSTARLAGKDHLRDAQLFQCVDHHVACGSFPGAFQPLNDDVITAHFFP
ncbi:hypothetical protein D3C87_1863370 [compost metagenome]